MVELELSGSFFCVIVEGILQGNNVESPITC